MKRSRSALSGAEELGERGGVVGGELLEGAGGAAEDGRDVAGDPCGVAVGGEAEGLGVLLCDRLGDAGPPAPDQDPTEVNGLRSQPLPVRSEPANINFAGFLVRPPVTNNCGPKSQAKPAAG